MLTLAYCRHTTNNEIVNAPFTILQTLASEWKKRTKKRDKIRRKKIVYGIVILHRTSLLVASFLISAIFIHTCGVHFLHKSRALFCRLSRRRLLVVGFFCGEDEGEPTRRKPLINAVMEAGCFVRSLTTTRYSFFLVFFSRVFLWVFFFWNEFSSNVLNKFLISIFFLSKNRLNTCQAECLSWESFVYLQVEIFKS